VSDLGVIPEQLVLRYGYEELSVLPFMKRIRRQKTVETGDDKIKMI